MNLMQRARDAWQPRLAALLAGLLFLYLVIWYFWLAIPDSTAFYVALQPLLALAGIAALAWTWAGLVRLLSARAHGEPAPVGTLWRPGRNAWLLALALLVLLMVVLFLVGSLEGACLRVIWKVPSWLTYKLNHPVRIPPFVKAVRVVFAFLEWGVLPALATLMLTARLRGLGWWQGWRIAHLWRMGLVTAAILVLLFWLPWQLVQWTPLLVSGAAQLISMLLRFGIAWVLATFGVLALLAVWSAAVEAK